VCFFKDAPVNKEKDDVGSGLSLNQTVFSWTYWTFWGMCVGVCCYSVVYMMCAKIKCYAVFPERKGRM
jgi:hypothetical protein